MFVVAKAARASMMTSSQAIQSFHLCISNLVVIFSIVSTKSTNYSLENTLYGVSVNVLHCTVFSGIITTMRMLKRIMSLDHSSVNCLLDRLFSVAM